MSTKKTTQAPKATKTAKAKKTAAKSVGKLSCLDAATKALGESKTPMYTKEMIDAMAANTKGIGSRFGGSATQNYTGE